MPGASTGMIANLKALQEIGASSRETIMEKTEYVSDVDAEKKRLQGEEPTVNDANRSRDKSENVDNNVK